MTSSSPSRKRPRLDDEPPSKLIPSPADERRLFRLWIQASRLAAAAGVKRASASNAPEPEADRRARREAQDAYLDALEALGLDGSDKGRLVYDPLSRRFVDHIPGLDPRPSSRLFFQYYPVATATATDAAATAATAVVGEGARRREFELRVINPDTKRRAPACTVAALERHLPRRYRGAAPRRVGVVVVAVVEASKEEREGEADAVASKQVTCAVDGVELRVYEAAGGGASAAAVNTAFLHAIERDECDVVYLWEPRNAAAALEITGPVFFPAYPALLAPDLLLLAPLHIYQCDGCGGGSAIQSLLERACGVLGALVVDRGAVPRLPYLRYDRQRIQGETGLASVRAAAAAAVAVSASPADAPASPAPATTTALEADGRALRITGRLRAGRYIPTFPHGWLSDDTAILLATALRAFRPAQVLELGAWLGLSSRFILTEGRGCARRFVTVDHFKNTAVGNAARLEDVAPLDKLYFRHLRFETFYANLERHCFGPNIEGGGGDGSGEAGAGSEPPPPPPPPEVVMLRCNVHEAPGLLHRSQPEPTACGGGGGGRGLLVFIDAEKDAGRLARLLRDVARLFPSAVVVGDDLAFPGVKQALRDVGVPEARLVRREEAYLILPAEGGAGVDKAAVLAAMGSDSDSDSEGGGVAARLAAPAWQREVAARIAEGQDDAAAAALGAEHGLGLGDVLYSPGKSILHDVCRRRDAAALAFLDRYLDEDLLPQVDKEEDGGGAPEPVPAARIPVNDVGLTPFDYLTDAINF